MPASARIEGVPVILVTGGAGFIGANFVLDWIRETGEQVVNLDVLTYAGNLENLASLRDDPRHRFVRGDICDRALVDDLLKTTSPRAIVHFAAESHVDRSILGPEAFCAPTCRARSRCSRPRAPIGRALQAPPATPSASSTCRPTRSTARSSRRPRRSPSATVRAQQPVLGLQGSLRPSGPRLAPHLRAARS
jgi:hypothetical protein